MIDAYSPCDFKTKGIQFATDIQELSKIILLSGWRKLWYNKTVLRRIYLKICDFISESNPKEMRSSSL